MSRTNDLLCKLISAVEAQTDNEWSHVSQDAICAIVDGAEEGQELTPILVYANGVYERTDYTDASGNLVTVGTIEIDPCGCPCEDCDCFGSATGEICLLLRTDANPASISQATLSGYTLEFTSADNADCAVEASVANTGALNTVDIGEGTLAIQNFADIINDSLGGFGFRAIMCDDDGGAGGTTPASEMIAVAGPTGGGSWEIKLDSAGTGDDFAIGWDDATGQGYSREWVNGAELTDPSNSYNPNGYWDVKSCSKCAP